MRPCTAVMKPICLGVLRVLLPVQGLAATQSASAMRLTLRPADMVGSKANAARHASPSITRTTRTSMAEGASATDECESCIGLIDYPRVLQAAPLGGFTAVALLFWAIILIWLLNNTAQDFFVPPLVYWSRLLRLRPEVAGATLVALGNGAPDAFAVISATQAQDTLLGLDTLLGAMMSGLCITGGAVLLVHERVSTEKLRALAMAGGPAERLVQEPFVPPLRISDYTESAAGLALALVFLAFLLRDGVVTVFEAALMPAVYGLYLVVLLWNRTGSSEEAKEPELAGTVGQAAETVPPLEGLACPSHASSLQVLLWAAAWPTYAIRWVLIPPADLHWNRCRRFVSSLAPSGLVVFCALTYTDGVQCLLSSPASIGITALAVIASLLVFFCSDDGPEVPQFYPALTLLSKASSILILSVISSELTACVETLGLLSGVPRLWLGTTVVAWGNSLGDLVTGIAMVRQGQMRTALTAVFASPLFNLLCSAGVALMLLAHRSGGSTLLWSSQHGKADLRMHIRFLLGSCSVLVTVLICGQRTWAWSLVLWSLYVVFLVCVLSAEQAEG